MDAITDTLIIHIGLSRTGTTSLQRRFFSQFSNTLTPYSTEEWKETLMDEMVHVFQDCDFSVWNETEGKKVVDNLKAACCKTSGKPFLISQNAFSRPFFFRKKGLSAFSQKDMGYFPVSLHLEMMLKACPWISKIKVLVTLRNQPEWLGSLYAKDSTTIKGASKEDFEQKVRLLMSDDSVNKGGCFNWGKLVHDLERIAGKDNIYVVLLEEMNSDAYWKTIAEWSELPFESEDYSSTVRNRENSRSISNQEWSISKRDFFWPELVNIIQKHEKLYEVVKKSYNSLKHPFVSPRPEEFTLSDELASEIRSYCNPFNRELAEYLERDFTELEELGY
ncbi:MAG: hypothetical protein JXQ82_09165 [Methanomicrobiaceae archaeon]|nr:hypothetical protein [Methanomicrobiaceae archaeon]